VVKKKYHDFIDSLPTNEHRMGALQAGEEYIQSRISEGDVADEFDEEEVYGRMFSYISDCDPGDFIC